MQPSALMLASLFVIAFATPTAIADLETTAPEPLGVGGYCDHTVHTMCGHETADGTCYLFVGGQNGACVAYGDGPVGYGGYCDQEVHTMCGHETALGTCYLFLGGDDGACIIYDGSVSGAVAASAPPPLVGVGGDCEAMVHTQCSHITAPGVCHVYVGGPSGACIVYGGGDRVFDSGGECSATIHTSCWHWSAPGTCAVFVGGADGRCIVY